MTYTWLPRPMTSGEKALIRTDEQSSQLYLWIYKPESVYTALINQTFTSLDRVVQLTYDAGSGTLADVLPGMTLYIGTTPGSYDVGMVRIRKAPTSDTFYIGEESEVPFADNLYLTVVDDFGLWARNIRIAANVPYMDYDIAYSDQHVKCNPVPILGPRYVPKFLTDLDVSIDFDASNSYVIDSTITGYVWVAPGSSSSSGLTTATPTITYDTPGTYRVACTLTAANGKTTTGYVRVRVFNLTDDMPVTQFDLKSCTGSNIDGGWKFSVDMWAQADLPNVVDRAMIVLFARDFYGVQEVSIGQIPDRENIITSGWIEGESITRDPDGPSVGFQISTANAWLKKISGFPIGIENTTRVPTAWTGWQGLTVDKSLYHVFFWQSTVIPVIDVFLTDDTKISPEQYGPGDVTLWDQLTYLLKNPLLGSAGCDRYNRLFCEVDVQLTPPANRSSFPEILQLEAIDWRDQMRMTRTPTAITSQVNLSGVIINLPARPSAVFSLAPGHAYGNWGKPVKQDRLLLSSQAQANELAALKLAWDNHNFDFEPDLAGNNRMVDVFPSHQYVGITVPEDTTPRDFLFDGNAVIREINISWASGTDGTNFLQSSWRMENEVFPGNSSNGDVPESSTPNFPPLPAFDSVPDLPPLAILPIPGPQGDANNTKIAVLKVTGVGLFYTTTFDKDNSQVQWLSFNGGLSDPTLVNHFEISASGRCFCQVSNTNIYAADQVGGLWTSIFDTSMIGNPGSFPFPRDPAISGFGINRDADDEVLVIAGLTVTIGSNFVAYPFYGGTGGFTITNTTNVNIDASSFTGLGWTYVTFGDGTWTWAYQIDAFVPTVTVLESNGASVGLTTYFTAMNPGEVPVSTRSRYGTSAFLVVNGATGASLDESLDNGTNFNALSAAPTPYISTFVGWESFITNDDGSKIVVGVNASPGFKRSSDYGAVWGNGNLFHVVTAVWNISGDAYITAGANQIELTTDFGDSFVYKTGDLQTWVGGIFTVEFIRTL